MTTDDITLQFALTAGKTIRTSASPALSPLIDEVEAAMAPIETEKTIVNEGLYQRKTAADAATNKSAATYTWQDVAKHNTDNSAWVIIRGIVYDVTEWADRHPGGRELVLLHSGRECTDTFDSYHPFSNRAEKILAKYAIGKLVGGSEFPTYKPDTGFYRECCDRVHQYFKDNNLDPRSPYSGLLRMLFVAILGAVSYVGMNQLLSDNIYAHYAWGALFGACQALPLLHVMHDASHAAITSSPTGWRLIGRLAMDWVAGANMVSWLNQHVVGHHIYTNVLLPIYKFQHIYLPPLYGVLGLKFRVQDIFETFISLTNGPLRVNPLSIGDWAEMIISKAFWAFYRIYIPLVVLQVNPARFWGVFLLAEFVTGWYLAFNFQVSHVSTACDYPGGDEEVSAIEDEWAISQIKSSVDYAHGSFLTAFLTGALNYQVTHHLFPGVSQYHYPAIAPIIMDVCNKYKIKYTVLPTFSAALAGHFEHLVVMGKMGKRVTVHMG
ncbi:Fatty acid desaturase [Phytophthora infestans]|uniref:Fatty acid desaturase n=1 Tax=Phytophthora infestans TaxID=4787 RepID=A0A833SIU4_PHYIN|nr:Fatty acid desaturase [Phytophthora infestans]